MKIVHSAILAIAMALAVPNFVLADPITIDFNDATPDVFYFEPYLEDGFRISVLGCHYDIRDDQSDPNVIDGTTWMGFDGSACFGGTPQLRLDRFGRRFNMLSIDVVRSWGLMTSSAGGETGSGLGGDTIELTGQEWRNLHWVDFVRPSGFDSGAPDGFDNIRVVAVSAPSTLALTILSVMVIFVFRRRRPALTRISNP